MMKKTRKHQQYKKQTKSKSKRKIRRKTSKQPFKKIQCGPKQDGDNKFSCYSNRSIEKMKNLWNVRHPDKKILTNNTREIWESLKKYMSGDCSNEKCWLEQGFVKNNLNKELLNHTFAPESPEEWKSDPNTWLSSIDILNVMKQYEKVYPCFEFIGPSPIDYDKIKLYGECVWEELCHFSLQEQINKKKTKIGVSFNLDPHYKPGSHWVSLFIDIKKGLIFYFDSNGDPLPRKIKKFANMVKKQGAKMNISFTIDENHPFEHQFTTTECGIYSLYFLINVLKGNLDPMSLKKKRIPDKKMMEFRKIYFNEATK